MVTYQDLIAVGDSDKARIEFVRQVIKGHISSRPFKTAKIADDYDRHRNKTICDFQKLLYTVSGKAVPDAYGANYKLSSNFFNRFVTQEVQFLLGNGVQWENGSGQLGEDFDTRLQEIAKDALVHGVAFGFVNYDHLEVFSFLEFAPLYDEENGALRAGVRFWQIDSSKPLRATLYEEDGYTDYIWNTKDNNEFGTILTGKRSYTQKVRTSIADGTMIYDGENYPAFPIVPLWGNLHRQSELLGIREQIDAYDLIKSGFCNTVDEASYIYWTLQNNGGVDDVDLAQFVERIKTVHAANVPDAGKAEAHTIEAPYASREALLDRLRADLYEDYMALDTKNLASGAVTATQIRAAYEPINSKADQLEYCVHDFIDGINAVRGVTDQATFTRSMLVNVQEEITSLVSAGQYLDQSYVTEKIMTILGDADRAEDVLKQMDADDLQRLGGDNEPQEGEEGNE
jgi:hypothetical protein